MVPSAARQLWLALIATALGGCPWVLPYGYGSAPADAPAQRDARARRDVLPDAGRGLEAGFFVDLRLDAPRDARRTDSNVSDLPRLELDVHKLDTPSAKKDTTSSICSIWSNWACKNACSSTECTSCIATCGTRTLTCGATDCGCQKTPSGPTLFCPGTVAFDTSDPCTNTCATAFALNSCCKS
jgi:hypothetical protein